MASTGLEGWQVDLAQVFSMCSNFPQFLMESSWKSERPVFIDAPSGKQISIGELWKGSISLAAGLRRIGVRQGDVVLLLSPNSTHYPLVCLGVMILGATVSCVNPLKSPGEVATLAKGSKLVVTTISLVNKYSIGLPIVLIDGDLPGGDKEHYTPLISEHCTHLSILLVADVRDFEPAKIHLDDTAVFLYPSGTSKGGTLSHRDLIATAFLYRASRRG